MGASDKYKSAGSGIPGSNCGPGNWNGPDSIYQIIPDAKGTLTATLDADYDDPFLRIRSACPGGTNEEVACQYRNGQGIPTFMFGVVKNGDYFLAADTWNNKSGTFTLTLSLQQ